MPFIWCKGANRVLSSPLIELNPKVKIKMINSKHLGFLWTDIVYSDMQYLIGYSSIRYLIGYSAIKDLIGCSVI